MMKLQINIYILLLLVIGVCGCNQIESEVEGVSYHPEFAIPLISDAAISFPSLWQSDLPNQSLLVTPDSGLVFRYQSDPAVVRTPDILGMLTFPVIAGLPDTVTAIPFNLPANLLIEEAVFSDGTLTFRFNTITDQTVFITFTLPQITLAGQALSLTTNGFSGGTQTVNLAGYTFQPNGNNELLVRYSATDAAGSPVQLANAGIIAQPTLQFIKGFWGREEFQLAPQSVAIDLYNERFLNGSIQFAQPSVTAIIESSFGVPIQSRVDLLNAYTSNGDILLVDGSAIDGVNINYPELSNRGSTETTTLQLDYQNANLVDIFSQPVEWLEFGLTAITNPENDTSLVSFVEDSSLFRVQVIVDVPVLGKSEQFIATDQFKLPEENLDEVTSGELKLVTDNELPLTAALQGYFLDENGIVLDSLFDNELLAIESAQVNESGEATTATEQTHFIEIGKEKIQHINHARQIGLKAVFITANNGQQDVMVQANQELKFRMGLKFRIN